MSKGQIEDRVVARLWSGYEARRCHFKNRGVTTNGKGQRAAEEEDHVVSRL